MSIEIPNDNPVTVPWIEILIDECRVWPSRGKIRQKNIKKILGQKFDGCMHLFPKLTGAAAPVAPALTMALNCYMKEVKQMGK